MGPVDLAALRYERERRRGHHMTSHLRREIYERARGPIYPAGTAADGPISVEQNETNMRTGRDALDELQES